MLRAVAQAERSHLRVDLLHPAAVGPGIRRARMKDRADLRPLVPEDELRPLARKASDADDPFGLEDAHDLLQVAIARREQRFALGYTLRRVT